MNRRHFGSRFIKIALAFIVLSVIAVSTFTAASKVFAKSDETVIIAASDWQNPEGSKACSDRFASILERIKNDGITHADGFLFCGDYDYDGYGIDNSVSEGISAIKEALDEFTDTENTVFAQGNHDTPAATNGMSRSGNNDPKSGKYGVFVINNDDYMWHNSDENKIIATSNSLKAYLVEKATANYANPIFIVSHLSLHYSMRTFYDGDGMYASHLFDIINRAGQDGLNIIFLYGHNHSNGWDDYLGGASVFLPKGDDILIAQNSRTEYKKEKLSFTYMNAGYIGYYNNHNGADDTLTATVFRIAGSELIINRYSSNGLHSLKASGVQNSYKSESAYPPNLTKYESPQKLTLYEIEMPKKDIINGEEISHGTGEKKTNNYALPLFVSVAVLTSVLAGTIIIIKKKKS